MLKLDNYYSGDYNTKIENELSSQQIERINQLLLEAIEIYPLEIGNSKSKDNNLNDILNQRKNAIYSTLKPFEIQKTKLYECIERLDKVIAITHSQRLNLHEKLEKIEKCEKKVLLGLLIEKQQNQNADGVKLIKSNNLNSMDDRKLSGCLRSGDKLQNICSATPMIRSQSVTIVKKNDKLNLNKPNMKNVIYQKSLEKLSSKKDDISNSFKLKLLNKNSKLKSIEKVNNNYPNKMASNNIISSSFLENFHQNETIKKVNITQSKNPDNKLLDENKTMKTSQTFPLKRNRISSIKIEKPIINSKINSIKQTEKPPIINNKQEIECSSSVSSEINVSQVIIKNENTQEIEKELKTEIKTILENKKTLNLSLITQKSDLEEEDLVQKILTKFDSVKQFIEKYKQQQKRLIRNSNFNHNNDNKRNFKDEYITEWITANKNSGNPTSNNQNLDNNNNKEQSIKSNSSISRYYQSICNLEISNKGVVSNLHNEDLKLKSVVCEDSDIFNFEKQPNETLKNP